VTIRAMTKFVLLIAISSVWLLGDAAQASPLDLLEEAAIQKSFQRLNQEVDTPAQILQGIKKAWAKKCADLDREEAYNCYLNECDINLSSCDSKRILLFRGEPGKYEYAGASPLLRNTLLGLSLGASAQSSKSLLKIIIDAFKLSKLNQNHLFADGHLALLSYGSILSWRVLPYESDEMSPSEIIKNLPASLPNLGKADPIGTFFFAAQSAGYGAMSFLDMEQGRKDVSPLVSLSPDPDISLRFSIKSGSDSPNGRLLVLSVPQNSIRKDCSKLEAPGAIVNYGHCVEKDDDDETAWERELNATLYIPVETVLYSIGTTKADTQ
jgi:hypothetical protein